MFRDILTFEGILTLPRGRNQMAGHDMVSIIVLAPQKTSKTELCVLEAGRFVQSIRFLSYYSLRASLFCVDNASFSHSLYGIEGTKPSDDALFLSFYTSLLA